MSWHHCSLNQQFGIGAANMTNLTLCECPTNVDAFTAFGSTHSKSLNSVENLQVVLSDVGSTPSDMPQIGVVIAQAVCPAVPLAMLWLYLHLVEAEGPLPKQKRFSAALPISFST